MITRKDFFAIRKLSLGRFCLSGGNESAFKLTEGGNWKGKFSTKFYNSVGMVFESQTGLKLTKNQHGYFLSIRSDEDIDLVERWVERNRDHIFIRDNLNCSVALAFEYADQNNRLPFGKLYYRAKYKGDDDAIEPLVEASVAFIEGVKEYREAPYICASPPRKGKEWDMPSVITKRVCAHFGFDDLTGDFSWARQRAQLKEVKYGDRWDELEAADSTFNRVLEDGGDVVLFDDMYQSGCTLEYVASKLLEAGADNVFGLCPVKTWSDTDNQ